MGAVKRTHPESVIYGKWIRDMKYLPQVSARKQRSGKAKLKRLYPNSIAPERAKVRYRISPVVGFVTKYANGPKITQNASGMTVQDGKGNVIWFSENLIESGVDIAVRNGQACIDGLRKGLQDSHACAGDVTRRTNPYLIGIDLASGKDQTGYGGRIE